jgi:hypothetical protein
MGQGRAGKRDANHGLCVCKAQDMLRGVSYLGPQDDITMWMLLQSTWLTGFLMGKTLFMCLLCRYKSLKVPTSAVDCQVDCKVEDRDGSLGKRGGGGSRWL